MVRRGSPMEIVDWNTLPSLVLHQIFKYLLPESRLAASSICKNWRSALYHPQFWHHIDLNITTISNNDIKSKVQYINSCIVPLVQNIRISVDPFNLECLKLTVSTIDALLDNHLLKTIDIEIGYYTMTRNENLFKNSSNKMYMMTLQNYLENGILKVLQRKNFEEFGFGFIQFLYWHDLIHMLAKYSNHSMKRLEITGLNSTFSNKITNYTCITNSTLNNLTLLTNLQKLSLDYNSNTCNLLPALYTMSHLEILSLRILKKINFEINDNIWLNLKKNCPKLGLRLTIINCKSAVKKLHRKLLCPSMPLTHLQVLFCNMVNVQVLRKLLDYRNTLQSLIWVDEHSNNPTSLLEGHWHIDRFGGDIETNPLIILSWVCSKLSELVVFGYFMETVDVCGIARLRGTNLKRFELLEEDICFNRPWSVMIFDDVVKDVSKWMGKNWKPLSKENVFVNHSLSHLKTSHYTLKYISNC
ncbi:F-box only protein 33-like isoform X2 [Daktulosphaira vitifoliae]|uniref:F-box only protein 33-like isoform X2 n=1 Tax=Daktulosphaira vitifoliae TaxID=58002 RepID=UPI0021A9CCFD|nr:F-box only protein 33-like isoform X2 [Daktulosphaira vitifoliae]